MTRVYKTPVAELRISKCIECPAHETVLQKKTVPKNGRAMWVSVPHHVVCKKTGRTVKLTALDQECPLPQYDGSEHE